MKKFIVILTLFFPFFAFADQSGEEEAEKLFKLSLEELMEVEIDAGSYTGLPRYETPVSLVVIDEEQIRSTPARNLLDLIEVYVPSATFVNHWLGPRIGMRGILGDQNTSFLLLVNGRNANMRTQNGPFFEIENRNLGDIEKIEIIRGPGSVTYGPGAIGGVINVITKTAETADEFTASAEYNPTYRYESVEVSGSYSTDKIKAYLYAGMSYSKGIKDPEFYYIDRAYGYGYGYMGLDWGNYDLGTPAPNFLADFLDQPQSKVRLDVEFLEDFRLWASYTSFGRQKQQQARVMPVSDTDTAYAFPGMLGQDFIASLEHKKKLSEKLTLDSRISYQTQNHRDYNLWQGGRQSFYDPSQLGYSYSQNDLDLKAVLNYRLNENFRFAFGGEYDYLYLGPEWFQKDKDFLVSMRAPLRFVVRNEESEFYKFYNDAGLVTVIDEPIDGSLYSLFFEANVKPAGRFSILLSSRFDKHSYSNWAISPRIAGVIKIDDKNFLKAVFQHSVRLPVFSDLYSDHKISNSRSDPELLRDFEIMYDRIQGENIEISVSGYYRMVEQVAWIAEGRPGLVGSFDLLGGDITAAYKSDNFNLGLSYSYIEQLSWEAEEIDSAYLSNIGPDSVDVYFDDYGENRINNLPKNMIKAYCMWAPIENLSVHADARFYFDFGQNEALDDFKKIHDELSVPEMRDEMNAIYDDVTGEGYGRPMFTSDFSVEYALPLDDLDLTLTLYSQNLLSVNWVRHVFQFYDAGNVRQFPRQVGLVREPATIGFGARVSF